MAKPSSATNRKRQARVQEFAWLTVCAWALFCSGCLTRKPQTHQHVPIAFAHPIIPAGLSAASLEAAPELENEPAPVPRLVTPHGTPPKPRVAQAAPTEPTALPERTDPMIIPDLTAEQLNAAKSETQHSLDIAELNLSQTKGKQLNSAQEDVASKVRGFMENARDAMKNSDWQRAKNLAKKAEVLSHELVANL